MENFKELTPDQFRLLSWFATCTFNMVADPEKRKNQFYVGKLQGIESACTFAGIPDAMLYRVAMDHNFTGLINLNHLTYEPLFK
ncbi:MAG: hypothetical protein ABSA76_06245 [Bacteroidales bacterium]